MKSLRQTSHFTFEPNAKWSSFSSNTSTHWSHLPISNVWWAMNADQFYYDTVVSILRLQNCWRIIDLQPGLVDFMVYLQRLPTWNSPIGHCVYFIFMATDQICFLNKQAAVLHFTFKLLLWHQYMWLVYRYHIPSYHPIVPFCITPPNFCRAREDILCTKRKTRTMSRTTRSMRNRYWCKKRHYNARFMSKVLSDLQATYGAGTRWME